MSTTHHTPIPTPTDPRADQQRLAERNAVIQRAGDVAVASAGLPAFDPFDDKNPEDYTAYLQRVATVRGAAEGKALRRLQSGTSVEELATELTRAAMPVAAPAVPVTVSSIVRPPTTPAPAPVGSEAPLSKSNGWQHQHEHAHDGGLVHGADGSHGHRHTHLDGTTHSHAHLHEHDHHDHHGEQWRLASMDSARAQSGHSHPHLHPHDHGHSYRAGEPVDLAIVEADIKRGRLTSSGKVSSTGESINAGYAASALKAPPVGSAAQMAAAGKTQSPSETVVPSAIGHRDLMNTEDAAALDFGMPEPADEATATPDDSLELDFDDTFHEGGHQPQAALGQPDDITIPRASEIGALIDLFKMGVINRAECRALLTQARHISATSTPTSRAVAAARAVQHAPTPRSTASGTLPSARASVFMPDVTRKRVAWDSSEGEAVRAAAARAQR
jgi:hypothetical protein